MSDLSHPAEIMARLEAIDQDLASRVPVLESAAMQWFRGKRDREKAHAISFRQAKGTVAERNATADEETALIAADAEAEYEAVRAVVRVLETRATIGMALLKTHTRVGA